MITLYSKLRMDMTGNLASQARTAGQALSSMSARGKRSLTTLSKAAQIADTGIDKLWNRYTALATGAGVTMAVHNTADLEERLTDLGIIAEKTQEDMLKLNQQIYAIAQQRDINIDPSQLLSAIEKIAAKTGDLDFAVDNMKNLAYAIGATGAAGEDVGALAGDLFEKFGIRQADKMISTIGLLANQGKLGAFELKDLATQGERVTAAYAMMGRTGMTAVGEMGALLQMAKKGTGSAEQAATAFEALVRNITDSRIMKQLQSVGIQVRDNNGQFRSAIDIVKDVIVKTKGDTSKLGQVFDTFAIRAISTMAVEYQTMQKAGKKGEDAFASINKFLNASREGQVVIDDSIRKAQNFNRVVTSLKTAFYAKAFTVLTTPLQKLTTALNRVSPEQLQSWLSTAGKIAVAVGGALLAYKTAKGVYGVYSFFKKPLTALNGGKNGSPFGGFSMAAPLPVYVVNNMGSAGDLLGIGGKKGRSAARTLGKVGKFGRLGKYAGTAMRFGGKALGVAGLGFAAYDALNAENKAALGGSIGSIAGGLIGAIGGPLGMMAGSVVGNFLGEKIGSLFDEMPKTNQKIVKSEQNGKVAKTQTEIKLEVTSPNAAVSLTSMKDNSTPLNQCKLDLSLGGRI